MVRTAGRWPHLLLVAGVVTIALSVLAMHQLAVDHTLAAPANPGWHQADHPAVGAGGRAACPAGSVGAVRGRRGRRPRQLYARLQPSR